MPLPRRRPAGGQMKTGVRGRGHEGAGQGGKTRPAESQTVAVPSAQILNLGRHLARSHTHTHCAHVPLRSFSPSEPLERASQEAPPLKERAAGNFPQDIRLPFFLFFFSFSPELFHLPLSKRKTWEGRKDGRKEKKLSCFNSSLIFRVGWVKS